MTSGLGFDTYAKEEASEESVDWKATCYFDHD